MNSENTPAAALDKITLAALCKADIISFHRHDNGDSFINATKKLKATTADPFAPKEITIRIDCNSVLDEYERPAVWNPTYEAFDMIHTPSYDKVWQTAVSLLRAGDVLRLRWGRGAGTTLDMQKVGFVGDRLLLEVSRTNAQGKITTLTFHVGQTTGRDNSARMIKKVRQVAEAV